MSPMNQIGVGIHSLRSEPAQRKTVQDPNTSSLKSYEQQCIDELRISNALLYERYNLYRNKRLEESRTKVHITVEQDTSPLSTSETRFDLESPCVACSCPHQYVFPREAGVLPGNPRSSNYSSQRCHRTVGCTFISSVFRFVAGILAFKFGYHQSTYLTYMLSKWTI
uniref:DUF3496 domain-containing protein n=1 Tax=Mus musculus TaxID=10090 RepID=Q3V065_MOUSE|nr:unnamed protein product [Mus musculus]